MKLDKSIEGRKLLGIVANNSISYVDLAFKALDRKTIVVPLKSESDADRISATGLSEVQTPTLNKGWFSPQLSENSSQQIAQISFTSGTEGRPKGVLISYRALHDVVSRLEEASAFSAAAREYIGVPVYHSFGYGRCRLLASVGGSGFIPEHGFSPSEIASMLNANEINSLSAVPSLLRILIHNRELFRECGKNLRWLEIGSQPMSPEEKSALRSIFPEACILQHYGLTEASRSTLLRIDQANSSSLQSVGKCYGDTEIKIIEQKIAIKGSLLASGLLIDGQTQPITNDDGWFVTSDLGNITDGHLFFSGRADNVINCGGQKIAAELLEKELMAELDLSNVLGVTKIADDQYGEAILLAYEKNITIDKSTLKKRAIEILKRNGISASSALKLLQVDKLPNTDTGKLQRKKLASWYEEKTKTLGIGGYSTAEYSDPKTLLGAIQKRLGSSIVVQPHDSIESLALDSITVVGISMEIERFCGNIPQGFRSMSFGVLAEIQQGDESSITVSENSQLAKGSINNNPQNISFWKLVQEDFKTHESDIFNQGFWAVFNHRFGNWRMGVRSKALRAPLTLIYRLHLKMVQIFCGIKLDYTVKLGRRVKLEHFGGMIIGAKEIGDDVTIRQNTTFGIKDISNLSGKPTLEKGVNVGTGAVIVGDIRVGKYTIVGPNCVIDCDIPPFSVVEAPSPTVIQQPTK